MPQPSPLQRPLEQSVGAAFLPGNEITVLKNGCEIFPAMLDAIEGARHTIAFETFVYWKGDIAVRFAEQLAAAARRGVRVRVLLDAFGARRMDSALRNAIIEAGGEIRWFRDLGLKIWRADNRTHRKILVVDDRIGFTGGVGIAEEWEGDARSPDEWRDTQVRIRGPAVLPLQAAFYDNWNEAGDWEPHEPAADPQQYPDDVPILAFRASSTIGWTDMATLFRTMVHNAEREVRIVSAYFVPDEPLIGLLENASRRGVDVRILIPGPHTDSRLSQLAGGAAVERLLGAGHRIWKYQKTMLHAKIVTIDGALSFIGSPNANRRSMGKDEECGVVAICETVAQTLNGHFDEDCENAIELDAAGWANRGRLTKLLEAGARLIIEQL